MTLGTSEIDLSRYRVVRSPRRTLALEIREDLELLVRVPHWVGERKIEAFVREKAGWIEKARTRILQQRERFARLIPAEGSRILFQGQPYSFWVDPALPERFSFRESFRIHPYWAEESAKIVETWFRRESARILTQKTDFFVLAGAREHHKIRIGRAQSRWGSCSAQGVITYHWRLIMCPPAVIDYVVIHELCHLQEMNHSRNFWNRVQALCPDYKDACRWLREHGNLLRQPIPKPVLIHADHRKDSLCPEDLIPC